MEKLMHVVRLRLTDEMRSEIRRYMAFDDRESFDETVRHLIRTGLETRMGGARKGLVVERGVPACNESFSAVYSGPERRKSSR